MKDSRIPMTPRSRIRHGQDSYLIEQFCFGTRFALAYLAHPGENPDRRVVLLELYPHPDMRMGGFVQRLDSGKVLIHNPFSALGGLDEAQLLQVYRQGLVNEIPEGFRENPEWFTDSRGNWYLLLDPAGQEPVPGETEVPVRNPLPLIPQDELASYLVLQKHPLYRYREENGEIHVLCLGSGVFMHRMILSILSCGQIPDTKLHIHIVSNASRENFVARLLSAAPLLESYADFDPAESEATGHTVAFHYQQVADILAEGGLSQLPYGRYILISLGNSDSNRQAAGALARQLGSDPAFREKPTVINYYCPEGIPVRTQLPDWLEADPFCETLDGYGRALEKLGRLTVRLAHLYNKLGNSRISLAQTRQQLEDDPYSQRSSCASALHLEYKLAGIGIDPAGSPEDIADAYRKALEDGRYGRLLANEHTRWMYYMMSDGYHLPTEQELLEYGFESDEDGRFNGAWRHKGKRLHPCLVPCGEEGIVLTAADWDYYAARESIEASAFDPLDRMSLKLHLLAREKCGKILGEDRIQALFREIADKLAAAVAEAQPEEAETPRLKKLRKKLQETQTLVCANAAALQYSGGHQELEELSRSFESAGLDISEEISRLKDTLSVFLEYTAFRDYKKSDEAIIRQLPWILFGDENLTLIMLCNQTIADSITTPLLMDPKQILYFGTESHPQWQQFLHAHGCMGDVSFVACSPDNEQEFRAALGRQIDAGNQNCVIDITGAKETAIIAAHRLCMEDDRVSLIRRTAGNTLDNIHGFPLAPIYTLSASMTAEDIFALHGAKKLPEEGSYMEQLDDLVPALWELYREHQESWNMLTTFFALPKARPAELYLNGILLERDTQWDHYTFTVDRRKWQITNLEASLRELEKKGLLKGLQITQKKAKQPISLAFRLPNSKKGETVGNILNRFFREAVPRATAPYSCAVTTDHTGAYSVTISSGYKVSFQDDKASKFEDKNGKSYAYYEVEPALRDMQSKGLLSQLEISGLYDTPARCRISFTYAHPALRDCLIKAGNILELYIWSEARKTHFFDDIQANFSFAWKEAVRNELDVVLTRGLTSLVVSAKTGSMNKEHLYELGQLTSRFSVNSIPVIVYTTDKAYEDGRISNQVHPVKQRAKAMGIHLIDLNELDCPLGEKLIRITRGEDLP